MFTKLLIYAFQIYFPYFYYYVRYREQFNVIYLKNVLKFFFLDYDNIFYTNIKNPYKTCFNFYYLYTV